MRCGSYITRQSIQILTLAIYWHRKAVVVTAELYLSHVPDHAALRGHSVE
jgi:hypothetical protein